MSNVARIFMAALPLERIQSKNKEVKLGNKKENKLSRLGRAHFQIAIASVILKRGRRTNRLTGGPMGRRFF